ncbi:MAG: diaminopimelate epimerase [Planctomycetaceae bacterium]|nr:diaminopimelate epimerase [Planctomycetaceae bacterium]
MATSLLRFTKMHGIGNDYVYVDGAQYAELDFARAARLVSDRHLAVGSDGLIAVCPPTRGDADARMRMFNADGSEGEMCGNGIRCVAKFAVDRGIALANPLRIETGRGVLEVVWERGPDGRVARASVTMGAPILGHARIPARIDGVAPEARVVGHAVDLARFGPVGWWEAAKVEPHLTLVSMGNPHVVFACEDPWKVPLELVGPRIERDAWFPARINAHFVRFGPRAGEATMRTWERGSGITLACGTGASAVCVAGVLLGRGARTLEAQLPGGPLRLEWPADDASVRMTGSATEVFEGEVDLDALAGALVAHECKHGAAHA